MDIYFGDGEEFIADAPEERDRADADEEATNAAGSSSSSSSSSNESATGAPTEKEPNIAKRKGNRRKIPMLYITDDRNRSVTFWKRKKSIVKKLSELETLTGANVFLRVESAARGHLGFVYHSEEYKNVASYAVSLLAGANGRTSASSSSSSSAVASKNKTCELSREKRKSDAQDSAPEPQAQPNNNNNKRAKKDRRASDPKRTLEGEARR